MKISPATGIGNASPCDFPGPALRGSERPVRLWFAALVLVAVAAASLLDGDAPDLVGGDDADCLVVWSGAAPVVSAAIEARPGDLCAARKSARFLPASAPASHRRCVLRRPPTARPEVRTSLASPEPLSARAPPRG